MRKGEDTEQAQRAGTRTSDGHGKKEGIPSVYGSLPLRHAAPGSFLFFSRFVASSSPPSTCILLPVASVEESKTRSGSNE